jgi:hypothetical protein
MGRASIKMKGIVPNGNKQMEILREVRSVMRTSVGVSLIRAHKVPPGV